MSILYVIGKVITLPGAYIKTFWEHFTCRILGIPVETTDYLRYNETLGHVEHEFTNTKPKSFIVCFLPGFINWILGLPMIIAGSLGILYLGVEPVNRQTGDKTWIFYVYLVLLYLGISLLCNLFPLVEDALLMWEKIYGEDGAHIAWKIILFIPAVCMVAGAYLERYSVNVLLALAFVAAGIFIVF